MKYIIECVQPDTVIFMGAQDDAYNWDDDMAASKYSENLTNVLIWSKAHQVNHFIYLSTMNVFGEHYDGALTEEDEARTMHLKDRSIYNGESLCRIYGDDIMNVTVLRFPIVYGPSRFVYEKLNPVAEMCLDAKSGGSIKPTGFGSYMLIYISDAVDAIYKTITKESLSRHIYHVEGLGVTSDTELSNLLTHDEANPVRVEETDEEKRDVYLDGKKFAEELHYAPHISVEEGLKRTNRFIDAHYEELNERKLLALRMEKEDARKRWTEDVLTIFRRGKRILENIALFALTLFLTYQFGSKDMFTDVDFMLLYVIIASLSFGVGHSIFAVLLAEGGNVYLKMLETGQGISAAISTYSVIIQFLFYLLIALMISYRILRFKLAMEEQGEQMADLQDDYELIYDMNMTNVEIKRMFEDRLLNYGDSIGKIYNIVSELDLLDPEKVAAASLGVVQRIMDVDDVCIYKAGSGEYFHFIEATSGEARAMKRAIRLNDYPEMRKVLETGDIFVNRQVGNELPRMAAPIYSEGRLIYVIMLWNMEFEQLNNYKKNLFLVLAKIITSSLEKGYQYEEADRLRKCYANTDVLLPEIFRKHVEERLKNVSPEESEYSMIQVDMGEESLEEISSRLRLLVRDEDKIGKLKDDVPYVYILAHAGYSDVAFVVNKLSKNGIKGKVVLAK